MVLQKLSQDNLTFNMKKRQEFFKRQLKFLCPIVSEKGMKIDQEKVRAVAEYLSPKTSKPCNASWGWQVGTINLYHALQISQPHSTTLIKRESNRSGQQSVRKAWTISNMLYNTHSFWSTQPDYNKAFQIHSDASDVGLGAILTRETEDGKKVVVYASRMLSGGKRNNNTCGQTRSKGAIWKGNIRETSSRIMQLSPRASIALRQLHDSHVGS